jgi:hypothetical protein
LKLKLLRLMALPRFRLTNLDEAERHRAKYIEFEAEMRANEGGGSRREFSAPPEIGFAFYAA